MDSLYYMLLLPPLVLMIISDFRCRKINIYWLIVLFAVVATVAVIVLGGRASGMNILFNTGLLVYWAVAWMVYRWIRYRDWANPLNKHIGVGDVLFFLTLTPMFEFKDYLIFLITALAFSLAWWIIMVALRRKAQTIPLVATSGLVLSGYIILKIWQELTQINA